MTKHTRDGLNRHTLAQRQRCECVARHVKGQIPVDTASRSYLFQVRIGLLVGINGEYMTFLLRSILILLNNELCALKENDIDGDLCLDTLGDNPFHAVELDNVLRHQCLDINVSKAGEAGEDKQVTNELKTLNVELLGHDGLNLFVSEEATVNSIQVQADTKEWVFVDDTKFNAIDDNSLERLHRLYCGVVAHVDLSHQKVLVVLNNYRIEFHKGHVLAMILLLQHFHEALLAKLVFSERSLAKTDTDLSLYIINIGLKELDYGTFVFIDAMIDRLDSFKGQFALLFELVADSVQLGTDAIEALVEVQDLCSPATYLLAFAVPFLELDADDSRSNWDSVTIKT